MQDVNTVIDLSDVLTDGTTAPPCIFGVTKVDNIY